MRKNILLFGTLISAFLLVSCFGSGKSNAVSESEANLKNANDVIDYYDISLRVLKKLVWEREVNAVLGYLEVKGKIPESPVIEPLMISVKDSVEIMNPGTCFDENTRQSLVDNYAGLFNSRTQFYKNYDAYKAYLKAKDYANGDKILELNYQLSIDMSEYKQNIFDILSPVVEQAEQVVLAGNPLKEQIMAVRQISVTMQSVMNAYAQKHVSASRMDKEIIKLGKQLEAAKKIPVLTGHDNEMKSFQDFLSKVETFLKEIQKASQNGEYSESEYESLIDLYGVSII